MLSHVARAAYSDVALDNKRLRWQLITANYCCSQRVRTWKLPKLAQMMCALTVAAYPRARTPFRRSSTRPSVYERCRSTSRWSGFSVKFTSWHEGCIKLIDHYSKLGGFNRARTSADANEGTKPRTPRCTCGRSCGCIRGAAMIHIPSFSNKRTDLPSGVYVDERSAFVHRSLLSHIQMIQIHGYSVNNLWIWPESVSYFVCTICPQYGTFIHAYNHDQHVGNLEKSTAIEQFQKFASDCVWRFVCFASLIHLLVAPPALEIRLDTGEGDHDLVITEERAFSWNMGTFFKFITLLVCEWSLNEMTYCCENMLWLKPFIFAWNFTS